MDKCYPCPCCGFLTVTEKPPGTFEICPVCNWEDDNVQFNDIDFRGGANEESLREARENFKKFRASSPDDIKKVKPPLPDEIPE